MKLFDSHAHYNDEKFDFDREKVLEEVWASGVERLINAGYNVISSKQAIEIADKYPQMYATCGLSPNDLPEIKYSIQTDSEKAILNRIEEIRMLAQHKKVVAIGEIGLDYHWNKENKKLQLLAFREQIKLANELKLPIVIHSRDAFLDTIQTLKENPVLKKGIFHCCQLNQELIRQAIDLDFYISFAGSVTFKNASGAKEAVSIVPMEKLLIETDSPYLSPEPNRGKRNDSRNLIYIAEKIAEIKETTVEKIAEQTFKNANKIYGIRTPRKKKSEKLEENKLEDA